MSRNGCFTATLSRSPSRIRIAGRKHNARRESGGHDHDSAERMARSSRSTHDARGRPGDRRRPAYREAERDRPSPRTGDDPTPCRQSDESPREPFRKKFCDGSRSRALYTGRAEKNAMRKTGEPTVTTIPARSDGAFIRPTARRPGGPRTGDLSRTGTLERGLPSPRTGDGPTPCGQSDESPQPFRKKVVTDRGLEPSIQIGVKRRAKTSRP